MDRTARFYSAPSYGAGFPVFSGYRRRRGGGILGSIAHFAMPMLKGLASKGARQALGLAKDVASDVMMGRDVKSSLIKHGVRRAKRLGSEMLGSVISAPSRKRKAPVKARQRSAKRRRTNF